MPVLYVNHITTLGRILDMALIGWPWTPHCITGNHGHHPAKEWPQPTGYAHRMKQSASNRNTQVEVFHQRKLSWYRINAVHGEGQPTVDSMEDDSGNRNRLGPFFFSSQFFRYKIPEMGGMIQTENLEMDKRTGGELGVQRPRTPIWRVN